MKTTKKENTNNTGTSATIGYSASPCAHKYTIKFAGSAYVTYCEKCGKIGDVKEIDSYKIYLGDAPTITPNYNYNELDKGFWNPNGINYCTSGGSSNTCSISIDTAQPVSNKLKKNDKFSDELDKVYVKHLIHNLCN